jgi:hypothetical protein
VHYDFDHVAADDSVFNVIRGNVVDSLNLFMTYFYYPHVEKSTDGGKTFERISFGEYSSEEHSGMGLLMYDKNIGILLFWNEMIITFDGWETYEFVDKGDHPGARRPMFFLDSENLILSKGHPLSTQFYKFNLKNNTWEDYSVGEQTDYYFYDLYFVNDTLGFGCGGRETGVGDLQSNVIWKTTDKGKTWEIIENSEGPVEGFGLKDIWFADEKTGMAVGGWGQIIETSDGGESWHYQMPPEKLKSNISLNITYAGNKPIIGNSSGRIFAYETVGSVHDFDDGISVNKFENILELEFEKIYPNLIIKISDILGRDILRESVDYQKIFSVDISELNSGPYFYQITSDGRIIKSGKFMK